ncbi:MAG: C45 family autoproteolytic acyltransferase/hydrolase [Candidatus Thorarchaeota archaeon]|jgi:predicted choloylglycine hydrolase
MTYPDYELVDYKFHHIVLEGSNYEIGQQLARYNRRHEGSIKWFNETKLDPKKFGFEDFESLNAFFEECCPGIGEEVRGFSDELGLDYRESAFYAASTMAATKTNCSQLLIMPSFAQDNQIYLGRSYEWNLVQDDCLLCTTRVDRKAAHIGLSVILSGRFEGMNEHGLVISTTGGGVFGVPLKNRGPSFWIIVRSLLENCRSVKECMNMLDSLPLGGYANFILVDKGGNAEHVEFADGDVASARPTDTEPFLYSLNHYRLPNMEGHNAQNCGVIHHSKIRELLIKDLIETKSPSITKEDIRKLLTTSHPNGLCNHFYRDGFGTTYSMIFDVLDESVDVCFSAPSHNEYRTFNLSGEAGITEYSAVIPHLPWTTHPR